MEMLIIAGVIVLHFGAPELRKLGGAVVESTEIFKRVS
jgi:Sec-independent protein translocase protein TatA